MKLCQYESAEGINCPQYVEGNTNYCASHNAFLRKLAKELLKPQKEIKRLPKVSPQRKDELAAYPKLKKRYLTENPMCELGLPGCEGIATEIHHCSTSAKDFLNTKTWKSADRFCHDIVERFMSAAERRARGFLI